ncbi:GNAT family N-acetyltransferase [Glaciibacter flavus]|uniref:GNAT family N-acetyltransferase n=1 Tax=Orlajensenia flava TaxID=2565934 RepID=UPI003B00D5C9
MIIRDATERDWPQVYPFFRDIVAAGETYAYPDGLSEEEAAALWMEKPPSRTVVAVDGDRVLGSAKMGPNRPGRGSHIATGSFMVDPSAAGRGVGRALGLHLIEWARREGYHGIQFNAVVATNERAMHLWRSLGFRLVGTVPGAFEHATQGRVGLNILYRDV